MWGRANYYLSHLRSAAVPNLDGGSGGHGLGGGHHEQTYLHGAALGSVFTMILAMVNVVPRGPAATRPLARPEATRA